jgi:hypothetical protein
VDFVLQRPLDVIVGDQEWAGSVLGDGKEREQKNYCKKSKPHKQSLPQVMAITSKAISHGWWQQKRLAIFRQPVG